MDRQEEEMLCPRSRREVNGRFIIIHYFLPGSCNLRCSCCIHRRSWALGNSSQATANLYIVKYTGRAKN